MLSSSRHLLMSVLRSVECGNSTKLIFLTQRLNHTLFKLRKGPRDFHASYRRLVSSLLEQSRRERQKPYLAPLIAKNELHRGGDRSCLHLEFDIKGSNMKYEAGDHLVLFPANDAEKVDKIFQLLKSNSDDAKESESCKLALTHYLDITSVPSAIFLKELAEFCTNESDAEKLRLSSSNTPEGSDLYSSWIVQDHCTIINILEDLPSCRPSLVDLCKILPRLRPRYYSISSGPKLHPDAVHITTVLVKGLATTWLANLQVCDERRPIVPICIAKSKFRLPKDHGEAVLMICQGTGLAPFRSFIQERAFARGRHEAVGETILYFGCRHEAQDYLYREELEDYAASGLIKLHPAFSRDQPEKRYVTHLLKENADEVWDLIDDKKGYVYICGNAHSMALDVRRTIEEIVKEKGRMTDHQVMRYLNRMDSVCRYSTDAWS